MHLANPSHNNIPGKKEIQFIKTTILNKGKSIFSVLILITQYSIAIKSNKIDMATLPYSLKGKIGYIPWKAVSKIKRRKNKHTNLALIIFIADMPVHNLKYFINKISSTANKRKLRTENKVNKWKNNIEYESFIIVTYLSAQ